MQLKLLKFLITCHLLFYLIQLILGNSTYSFRYKTGLQVPRVRTSNFGKKSFRYAVAVL